MNPNRHLKALAGLFSRAWNLLAVLGTIAVLGVSLGGAVRPGEPTSSTSAAPGGPAAAPLLDDFGGAEIDDSTALQRNFGESTDDVQSIVSGDMDGDGDLDLVVGRVGQDAVFLNDGAGNFDEPGGEVLFNTADAIDPDHFALGDLDNDGDLDAIGWWEGPSERDNALFLNDGAGSLGDRLSFPGGNSTIRGVAIADLNGDGALDVVLGRNFAGPRQNTVVLNANTSESPPSFQDQQDLGRGDDNTVALAAGDVDDDGDVDIAVANGDDTGDQVSAVYLNDGDGGFYSGAGTCAVQWQWGAPTSGPGAAHSGTNVWATNLDGDYSNSRDVSITSPAIDLSGAGTDAITLDWWQYVDVAVVGASIDVTSVEVSKNDGGDWETVWQFGSPAWENKSASLDSSYAVADFRVRFGFDSDAEDTDAGFYVDDVRVQAGATTVYFEDFEAGDGGYANSEPLYPDDQVRCLGELGHDTRAIALGDVDGDGDLDVVTANQPRPIDPDNSGSTPIDGDERLHKNDGTGRFDDGTTIGGSDGATTGIALADIDGDGRLDVVVANDGLQNLVLYNDGGAGPGFATTDTVGPDGATTVALAVADVDGDGALDIALGNDGAQSAVYLSPGALGFMAAPASTAGATFDMAEALALGDIDLDGDLDLVAGNSPPFDFLGGHDPRSHVYFNDGSGGFGSPEPSFPLGEADVRAVAVADLNSDDDLEIVVGIYSGQLQYIRPVFDEAGFWYFEGGCPDYCFGTGDDATLSLATGDLDHDGDLDIVVGREGSDAVFFNDGNGDFTASNHTFGDGTTTAVALGDLDGDSYVDLVVGNMDGQNAAYLNDGTGRFGETIPAVPFGPVRDTRGIALGDMNGDGKIDAVVGNEGEQSVVYLGDGTGNLGGPGRQVNFGSSAQRTRSVAVGDINGDGVLDVVAVNTLESNVVYLNDRADPPGFTRQRAFGYGSDTFSTSVALGDINGDGTLDIVVGNQPENDPQPPLYFPNPIHDRPNDVYFNRYRRPERLPDSLPYVQIGRPGDTGDGQGLSVAEVLASDVVHVDYRLFDAESDRVEQVKGWFSLDGGGTWQEAVPLNPAELLKRETLPTGQDHEFRWVPQFSGFFGQSDEVVFRIQAFPQPPADESDSTHYIDAISGPRQWPNATAATYRFRMRGTQVRVFREDPEPTNAAAGASVYRLPSGQTEGAFPLTNAAGVPLVTDAQGFLQGHATIEFGDILFALWPAAVTEHYTLYHISGQLTNKGVEDGVLEGFGLIPLIVSAGKPLMLFNLDVSLEWDARGDEGFMQQLRDDLKRTSEVLFDVTNGQVALGEVRIYHAKQEWLAADVIVHAANNLRPAAALGGVVDDPMDDVHKDSRVIEDAYVPGQIQMGPAWGRFGDPGDDLGDDWPRALAHELGHYLLFMPDNYLGIVGGRLVPNDCYGSYMTDAYIDEYSEMLDRDRWTGACLDTVAENTTGRTDWETILTFYPWLNTDNIDLTGPNTLTLDVTEIEEFDPGTPATALDTPFYSLRESGAALFVPSGGGQGYLFKKQDTPTLTDDYVLAVGSPVGDQMHARGAEPGDRLCVFDQSREPVRIGCQTVSAFEGTFNMAPAPGWKPQIQVSPVATDTLAITVTQAVDGDLFAQIMPTTGLSTTFPITATVAQLFPVPGEPDTYASQVQLAHPTFQAFVRVWEPDTTPPHEAMTQFVLGEGWGPNRRQWGPNRRQWGPNRRQWGPNRRQWGAPVSSPDGQASIYNLDDIFGDTGTSALQSLTTRPPIPAWLEPVGNVLRFEASANVNRTIAFNYLQQEVPGGNIYERNLLVYFSPDAGSTWQALDTILDVEHNLATALMPDPADDGLYMLAATVTMPALVEGWNQIGYPIHGLERAVTDALVSIANDYRLVYEHDPSSATPWRLYAQDVIADHPEFADLVNDLVTLRFGGNYWIYALEAAQLFFGLPVFEDGAPPSVDASVDALAGLDDAQQLPPATYYGPVSPTPGFTPSAGMTVLATVDGMTCGEAMVVDWLGALAYKIQVRAVQPDLSPCGTDGAAVVFSVDGQIMADSGTWDNTQTHYLPLGTLATGADLSVTQVVLPDPPQVGRSYAYEVTVKNGGPLPATEIVLRAFAPDGATITFATDNQRYCTTTAALATCAIGGLPPFGTRTVVVVVTASATGPATHDVTVEAFEPDPDDTDNTSSLTHTVSGMILDDPTAVSLRAFRAVVGPDGRHEITWQTGSETDVMGFLIRRAPRPEGPYQRITPALIPSRGTAMAGAQYRYVVADAGPAFYRLETVALDGLPEMFGPVPILPRSTRAYVPWVVGGR